LTKPKYSRVKLWTAWPDEDVETLKRLQREKNSASEIAEALTRQTGRYFTRNAIIGKINRLGLQGQGQLATRLTKSKKRKPRAAPEVPPPNAYDAVLNDLRAQRDQITTAIHLLESETPASARLTPLAVDVVSLDLEFPSAIEIVEEEVEIVEEVEIAVSDRVTLSDIGPGVCKWPIGDPLAADFTFCGDACDVTRPYCELHHKIAYVPITKQKQPAWRVHR
jgi:GcrA cell cycle regulator